MSYTGMSLGIEAEQWAEPLQPTVTPADLVLLNFLGRLQYDAGINNQVRALAQDARGFFNLRWASLTDLEHERGLAARRYVEDALEPLASQGFSGMTTDAMITEAADVVHQKANARAIAHRQILEAVELPLDILGEIATGSNHEDNEIRQGISKGLGKYTESIGLETAIIKESGMTMRFQIVEEELVLARIFKVPEPTVTHKGWLRGLVNLKRAMETLKRSA